MRKEIDFHARVSFRDLDILPPEVVKGICTWLRTLAKDIQKDPKKYSKNFFARYVK